MSNSQVANSSRPDAMPECELDALSRIYRKAIERYEEANAAGEDAKKEVNNGDSRAIPTIPC